MSVLSQNKYICLASELFSRFLAPFQWIKYISIGLILLTSVVLSELSSSPFPRLILRLHVLLSLLLLILKKESQKPESIDWHTYSELLIHLNIHWYVSEGWIKLAGQYRKRQNIQYCIGRVQRMHNNVQHNFACSKEQMISSPIWLFIVITIYI